MNRRRTTGGAATIALLVSLMLNDAAGAVITTTSSVTTVATYPSGAGGSVASPDDIRFAAGAVYEVYGLGGQSTIRRRVIGQAPVVVAGGGTGASTDGSPAAGAALTVFDFDVSPEGTIVFVEGNRVRQISAAGVLTTIGGNGSAAPSGDGGPATQAGMKPTTVGIDGSGNVLVGEDDGILFAAPSGDERVRRIAPNGTITTLATFPATDVPFNRRPVKIAFDTAGNAYLVMLTDLSGVDPIHEIHRVAPDGTKTRIGPSGDSTDLDFIDVDVAGNGTIYFTDVSFGSGRIGTIAANGTQAILHSSTFMGEAPVAIEGTLATVKIRARSVAVTPSGDLFLPTDDFLVKATNAQPTPAVNPVQPARILDTRPGAEQTGYTGAKPIAGSTVSLQVAGRAGVPLTGVAAVTMNVVITDADGAGFVTLWPSGQARPLAANLNAEGLGSTVANLVTVPLGADGRVNLFTQSGGHLIADVSGWVPAGVYVPKAPTRILETRPGAEQKNFSGEKPGVGGVVELQITGQEGIPTTGVAAVVLNLTATDATNRGFVTAFPSGQALPLAASLYLDAVGATAPNQVTVPIGAGGKISIFVQSGAHLIADLAGYYTVSSGFTPVTPARLLDTRPAPELTGYAGVKPTTAQAVNFQVAGRGGLPTSGVGAVVLNLTATEATAAGFVTAWPGPASTPKPLAAVINLTYAGQTRSNAVLVPVGVDGTVNLFTQSGTHLIVDVMGWFPAG